METYINLKIGNGYTSLLLPDTDEGMRLAIELVQQVKVVSIYSSDIVIERRGVSAGKVTGTLMTMDDWLESHRNRAEALVAPPGLSAVVAELKTTP